MSDSCHHKHMIADFRRRFWISLLVTIPVVVFSDTLQSFVGIDDKIEFAWEGYLQFIFAAAITFYGGMPFFKGLLREMRQKRPGMMTLIAVAVAVSFVYSSLVVFGLEGKVFFWELATLIDIMLLGHWIEMRSVAAAMGSLEQLVSMMPDTADRLREDGDTEQVKVEQLEKGQKVLIKPGGKIPIDGIVVEGHSSVNQAMVTGESEPVKKKQRDEVIGGTINGESSLVVKVHKKGKDSYLSQMVEMVEKARSSRSQTQNVADKAAFALTIIAVSVAMVTLAAWLSVGSDLAYSLERSITVMITTCPHALGLAIPLVVAVSTSLAAGKGLLVRERNSFERARNVDTIVFDKTGTLTEGVFEVINTQAFEGQSPDEILALAGGVEQHSEHPIGTAVVQHCRNQEIKPDEISYFEAIPGSGAKGKADGREIRVVSQKYMDREQIPYDHDAVEKHSQAGGSLIFVLIDGKPAGLITVADKVRDSAKQAVQQLRDNGLHVMMITGDSENAAAGVAQELGLDDYFAQVLPDRKAEKIQSLQKEGKRVAMIGDGINDAPALVQADIGIAIGAGTDVAIDSADIVLVESDPRDVTQILSLSKKTYSKMIQNLWWAAGYNIVAIPLAAGVLFWAGFILKPAAGAVIMSLSTIIVAINAQSLKLTVKD